MQEQGRGAKAAASPFKYVFVGFQTNGETINNTMAIKQLYGTGGTVKWGCQENKIRKSQ